MKILLVAEGVHELGDLDDERFDRGALHEFVRRLLPDAAGPVEFVNRRLSSREVETQTMRQSARGKGHRLTARALRFARLARQLGCDAAVLVADEDDEPARRDALTAAQNSAAFSGTPRAFGVAVRAFDAWILADEKALGRALACRVPRGRPPEAVAVPKAVCTKLRDDSPRDVARRDLYAEVAAAADLGVLRTRCPKGFAPFAGRVAALVDEG